MNLLARILSHGFALAVVVLIAIALMYRGDLFPEWDLPEFLVIEDKSSPGTEVPGTTVDGTSPEISISSPATTISVTAEAPSVDVAPDADTNEVLSPATMSDAAGDTNGLPEEPVIAVPDGSQETDAAVATDITSSVVDASEATGTRITDDTDQADEAPAAPSVPVTEREAVSEQPESPAADMAPPSPATESVNEPAAGHESAGEEIPVVPAVSVEESEVVTEQAASPAADMTMSAPVNEPVTETGPEPLVVEEPVVPSPASTEKDTVAEQPESLTADMTPPAPVTEPVTASQQEPEPEPEIAAALPVIETVTEDEVVTDTAEVPSPAADPATGSEAEPTIAETPAVTPASSDEKSAYELLAAAREAYWLHDYEGAENHYRRLIQLESDNPDWYGELGNMYFAQGQWEQAATAYHEAGVRLLKDGQVVQARQMLNVIRGLNGAGADDLEAQINNVDQVTR